MARDRRVVVIGAGCTGLVETMLGPLGSACQVAGVAAVLRRDALLLARRMTGSIEAFGLDVFDGATRPTAWFCRSAQHFGPAPSTAGSGAFGFLLQLLAHSHGWPFPAGGQGRIIDALMAIAMREGVQVRCDATVARILIRSERAAGVQLRGGEVLPARDVVTTISARPLASLLSDDALPDRLMRRLRISRYSTAAFKLDYALAGPPWTAEGRGKRRWCTLVASSQTSRRPRTPVSVARCRNVRRWWSVSTRSSILPARRMGVTRCTATPTFLPRTPVEMKRSPTGSRLSLSGSLRASAMSSWLAPAEILSQLDEVDTAEQRRSPPAGIVERANGT